MTLNAAKKKPTPGGLILAAETDDMAAMKELLRQGKVKAGEKGAALDWAAGNRRLETAQLLIDNGADVNWKSSDGHTILMSVAQYGRFRAEIVRLLVDSGASLDEKDRNGKTALDLAKDKGHADIIEILQEAVAAKLAAEKERLRRDAVAVKQQRLQKQSTHKLIIRRTP